VEVLILLIFLGICVVAVALYFFVWTVRAGSLQHADRLALLPLREDAAPITDSTDHEGNRRHESN
jgi:cbb3-type cytochrome oxidase maturation protein